MKNQIHLGQTPLNALNNQPIGKLVELNNEEFYLIENYDQMQPFFMSVVSDSDHWMYLSSNGSLTAGRANPESAIFPYYTDDKIHDSAGITGPYTAILATIDSKSYLWVPFSAQHKGIYNTSNRIYKNEPGNKVLFEEENTDLQIVFRYTWMNSERFGWIRKSELINHNRATVQIQIIDGIQNILPYGVNRTMQGMLSTLVDAYKKSELVEEKNLAVFRLSSIPVDRAEPSEALKATTVWSYGLNAPKILLGTKQIPHLCSNRTIETEKQNLGTKGAYLQNASFELLPNGAKSWYLIAEVNQDVVDIKELLSFIATEKNIPLTLENDVLKGTRHLLNIIARADGLQLTADRLNVKRHFANTMFNCMRGGIPFNNYLVDRNDFEEYIQQYNQAVYIQNKSFLKSLEKEIPYYDLVEIVEKNDDKDLIRLGLEYLPLMFSRRHGDPSRPWNLFNIKLKNEDGSPSLYYQGNWRDIFQNWEALAMSYPEFIHGMIAKFLNASTIDGYNAYKITRDGIEWEVLDPEDPWSNIGYWGDHQIIYLEKLLELSQKFYPGKINSWLGNSWFTYANVPYRHKSYSDLLQNPNDAIDFDEEKHQKCLELTKTIGADGKLIQFESSTYKVNLTEKLLVPMLSKLSNFVPGAGIWMNTQRPEWNDANNALVGIGASMVTLYYLKRYVTNLQAIFEKEIHQNWDISREVFQLFDTLNMALSKNAHLLKGEFTDENRKLLTDALAGAGSDFRNQVYSNISGEKVAISGSKVTEFLNLALSYIDHSIALNKRNDGLYHAYNLLLFNKDRIGIRYLSEMLEGQVAILSSGYLDTAEANELLNQLRKSKLYRPDQNSYILYPNKVLPDLLQINNLQEEDVAKSGLLSQMLKNNDTSIITRDIENACHFNGSINNAETLKQKLKQNTQVAESDMLYILQLYEKTFDHQSFTGRSGTFYKFEGLGCIYWHMVSKLLLAVGENIEKARHLNQNKDLIDSLSMHYSEIRDGIGSHKDPGNYGAFPTDPYSHTPSMSGVQQPGMTGQVKEDLLSRLMELGVEISDGNISFNPRLVKKQEYIHSNQISDNNFYKQTYGIKTTAETEYLAFTLCGTPVVYQKKGTASITLHLSDNASINIEGHKLTKNWSSSLFRRNNKIKNIEVFF